MKSKSQGKIKINRKAQFGTSRGNVLVEDGEVYLDEEGNLVETIGLNHHDNIVLDASGNPVVTPNGQGGQVVNAQSVISDSYEKVKNDGRRNTQKEKVLKFDPKDAKKLIDSKWFSTNKPMSGSELVKEAIKQRDKHINKYAEITQDDQHNKTSKALNTQQNLSDEEIYEIVFQEQEARKSASGLFKKEELAQYGGSTYVQRPIRNPEAQFIPDSEVREMSMADPIPQRTYAKSKYPSVNLRYINDRATNLMRQPDGSPRAFFEPETNTAYIGKNSASDLPAELAHAEQLSDMGGNSWLMNKKTEKDIRDHGFEGRYNVPGTLEYNAHETREPRIQDDYADHTVKMKRGAKFRSVGGLEYLLGRKNPHPFVKKEITSGYQYGGIPKSLDGLYEYPDQPVIVPSGDIMMEGINYDVDAYDANTGEFLETMQPNQDYQFDTDEVLEIPSAQFGGDRTQHYRNLLSKAQAELNKYTTLYKNAKSPSERKLAQINRDKAQASVEYLSNNPNLKSSATSNRYPWNPLGEISQPTEIDAPVNNTARRSFTAPKVSTPVQRTTVDNYEANIPEPYIIKQGDSLNKIANAYGLTVEDLLKSNPDIADKNRITTGDRLNIPEVTIKAKRDVAPSPVDRMSEIEGLSELPQEKATPEDIIPTLNVVAETVAPLAEKAKDIADKVKLGKIDRTQGTNALREMMRANRSINLPYRQEVAQRTLGYTEEDVTPYLDEIDSAVNQQLQYVNQNTSQGQAILANVMNNSNRAKKQTINRVNQSNLQRRQQVDNANVQMQNQFDMMQEQSNKNYVDETYQTLANYDRNRVQQADYLDQMVNNNTRLNNTFTLQNIKNPNFQIDPETGEIYRVGTPIKSKWGFKGRR